MKESSPAGGHKTLKPGDDKEVYPIFGRRSVMEALRAKRHLEEIWVAKNLKGKILQDLKEEAEKRGVEISTVDKNKLPEDLNHQGIVAWAKSFEYQDLDNLLLHVKGSPPLLLVLDHLEDPHNFGAILRTAEAAGVDGVIIPDKRSVEVTPIVSKVSAGASELVPIAKVTNIARCIEKLKEKGYWVFGLDPAEKQTIWEADLNLPCAVVIGNEGKGISRLVLNSCDFLLKLPMQGNITSLNVSVATAVFLYEILRQKTI